MTAATDLAPAPAGYRYPPPADCTLAFPGVGHLAITAGARDNEWLRATPDGQVHDGDLTVGASEAAGLVRLHYRTAAEYRALALAASRIADWLEETA